MSKKQTPVLSLFENELTLFEESDVVDQGAYSHKKKKVVSIVNIMNRT